MFSFIVLFSCTHTHTHTSRKMLFIELSKTFGLWKERKKSSNAHGATCMTLDLCVRRCYDTSNCTKTTLLIQIWIEISERASNWGNTRTDEWEMNYWKIIKLCSFSAIFLWFYFFPLLFSWYFNVFIVVVIALHSFARIAHLFRLVCSKCGLCNATGEWVRECANTVDRKEKTKTNRFLFDDRRRKCDCERIKCWMCGNKWD